MRFIGKNIHVLNKNERCIKGIKFAADVESRHNVILLGDSLGDIEMSHGVQCTEIVRVGFLDDNVEVRDTYTWKPYARRGPGLLRFWRLLFLFSVNDHVLALDNKTRILSLRLNR